MKKVFSMFAVLLVVFFGMVDAYADDYDNLVEYVKEKGEYDAYNNVVKDGTYYCLGRFDLERFMEDFEIHERPEELKFWFHDAYQSALMSQYPEYGYTMVGILDLGEFKGSHIYHFMITPTAEECDMCDWIPSIQSCVEAYVVFE